MSTFAEMFGRLLRADAQSQSARTVEMYGWLILLEGGVIMLFPHFVASILHFAPLASQGSNFLRLVGLLVGGVGMLYLVSGRLNAEGFVFASLLDRPLVPPIAAVLWYLEIMPGALALLFALQDFGSFLWTLKAWRSERRAQTTAHL